MRVIKLGKVGTPEFKKHMKTIEIELEIGLDLGKQSENLVKLYRYFIEDESCYLIMEYCEGGSLQNILDSKQMLTQYVLILLLLFYYYIYYYLLLYLLF
jgi:serine/threonine protein kinase